MNTVVKTVLVATLATSMLGCAGLMQSASVMEAHKAYDEGEYQQTLVLITQAENARETTPEMQAELVYLKASSYEQLGQVAVASTLYEYLAAEHSDSQYGYLASSKLEQQQKE
ncbi:MAG: hypothetical protein AAGI44_01205 [Pseudomonadota bacterium]